MKSRVICLECDFLNPHEVADGSAKIPLVLRAIDDDAVMLSPLSLKTAVSDVFFKEAAEFAVPGVFLKVVEEFEDDTAMLSPSQFEDSGARRLP